MQTIVCSALLLCFAFATPLRANDVITNFMSPIVSYQYPDDFSSQALTNGGIMSSLVSYEYLDDFSAAALTNGGVMSPIVSYQFFEDFSSAALTNGGILSPLVSYQYYEWPGNGILNLQSSPTASYYYPLLDAPVLNILFTNRVPTTAETTPAWINNQQILPPSQLEIFSNGAFTTNAILNPNAVTTVLTHGWIPTLAGNNLFPDAGTEGWPTEMARQLRASGITGNIVAWNWTNLATSSVFSPEQAGRQTTNGLALGQALLDKLGANYSQPIHFVGHSFGTIVNAYAANFLQGTNFSSKDAVSPSPWPAANMLMTLFDEAEIGTDKSFNLSLSGIENWFALASALAHGNGSYLNTASPTYHPLPTHFAWAENYVSAFGLLLPNAVNVILTNGYPTTAPDPLSLFQELGNFHFYPVLWYQQTIQTDSSAMGFVWPFLWSVGDPAFATAPTNGSVYVQNGSEWDLTQTNWDYGTNFTSQRLQLYGGGLGSSSVQFTANTLTANGTVTGQSLTTGLPSWMLNMSNRSGNGGSSPIQLKAQPLGSPTPNGAGGSTIIPAYAWMELIIPPNAVSMAFDYKIQGDWQSDSLAAAFNGTNVLLIAGNTIQTNVTFSSGAIDVSAYAGQTNEFFIGVVGGTSTNAELTVMNLVFSISLPPLLQAQSTGNGWVLSWPLSAQNFSLQTTTNLADPNSWTTLTNVPAVVDLQNTVTNPVSGGAQFYRLKK